MTAQLIKSNNNLSPISNFQVLFTEEFGWIYHEQDSASFWFRGHVHGHNSIGLFKQAQELLSGGLNHIKNWLDGLNGHFSLVVKSPKISFCAVDPVRSYPLIWTKTPDGTLLIDHVGKRIQTQLNLNANDIDPDMAKIFALSGFTIGNSTIYSNIFQIDPGCLLLFDHIREPSQFRYHKWKPQAPASINRSKLKTELSSVNLQLIEDLISSANGRPIVVPLSAGLDSRFILSGLVHAGYPNVKSFSYGLSGNREAKVAMIIARQLGVPWTFIPYNNRDLKKMFHSNGYKAFMEYSDSLTSIHFPQEYFALTELKNRDLLPSDAIMVNGQSGDFIAGNHIPATLAKTPEIDTPEARKERIISALITKHYKHWRALISEDRLAIVRTLLENEIDENGGLPKDPAGDHGVYEYCEFQDRQSKYVINGQRLYEFFDLEWRLPLWERRYLDFWQKAPLEQKLGERLYKDVLVSQNWGGVWKDIPINPTSIRPNWVRPLRLVAKALCAPFGRSVWHAFEKRYFDYFMATTSAYAAFPYTKIARDRRGHYSAIGWHIEAYLNGKGLDYDGCKLDGR